LFVLIVVGNLCVLSAIAISGQGRKTRMNFFIMHLAIDRVIVLNATFNNISVIL
jgi:neuropeptide S receptor 1